MCNAGQLVSAFCALMPIYHLLELLFRLGANPVAELTIGVLAGFRLGLLL